MKYLIALAILTGGLQFGFAAEAAKSDSAAKTNAPIKLKAVEAKSHVGDNAVVTGTIAEVNQSEKLIRLNFEKPYPDNVFTAVIFSASTNQFPEVEKLKGKTVEVSGKIADYHSRPQIVVNSTNQVKVLEHGSR